jgi:L-lysine exporter family protein LysE/ArgO
MLTIFFQGFLFGLGAAVPLGPVNILIMNTALKNYKAAVSIGFGALSADLSYLLLIIFGLVTFLDHPIVLKSLGYL